MQKLQFFFKYKRIIFLNKLTLRRTLIFCQFVFLLFLFNFVYFINICIFSYLLFINYLDSIKRNQVESDDTNYIDETTKIIECLTHSIVCIIHTHMYIIYEIHYTQIALHRSLSP